MSKPGADPSSGISSVDVLIPTERHPVCRQREARPGCRTERENLAGSVWWDHALQSWGDYEIQIRNALNEARAVVVIWTKVAGESRWVKSEAGRASRDHKLVNVRAPGLERRDVPSPMTRITSMT
jgi:hypothetical protein